MPDSPLEDARRRLARFGDDLARIRRRPHARAEPVSPVEPRPGDAPGRRSRPVAPTVA